MANGNADIGSCGAQQPQETRLHARASQYLDEPLHSSHTCSPRAPRANRGGKKKASTLAASTYPHVASTGAIPVARKIVTITIWPDFAPGGWTNHRGSLKVAAGSIIALVGPKI